MLTHEGWVNIGWYRVIFRAPPPANPARAADPIAAATNRPSADRSIGWSVSFATATTSRGRRRMKMRWSEAPEAQAVSAGSSGNSRSALVRKQAA